MNYLYYDYQTGEYFYVNAEHKDGADRIWHRRYVTADMNGYDTY